MRKYACIRFFEKTLREVSKGNGSRECINPAVQFANNAKAGVYDKLSDEKYELWLHEAQEISEFWSKKPEKEAIDVLWTALEKIDIDRNSLNKIAGILAECYLSTVDFSDMENIPEGSDLSEEDSFFSEEDSFLSEEAASAGRSRIPSVRSSSPQKIYEWLSRHIYGQEKAVKAAAMLLYNHEMGRKRNVLFIGQTGSGKTEIWRVCKQLNPNIRIIDSTMITGEGWSGSFKIKNVFDNMSRKDAEKAIIVFDEFDKFCEPKVSSSGTNHSLIMQNELLKLIEGTTLQLKDFSIDTSKISFVFCGSFERLTEMKTDREAEASIGFGSSSVKKEAHLVYEDVLQPEDLVKYSGMRLEIAGRINQIVQLTPMTAGDFQEILKNEQISPLHQLERQYGVKLRLDQDTEQKLVQEAERTRMGVRYLRSRIQQMLDEQMFRDCGQTEYSLSA